MIALARLLARPRRAAAPAPGPTTLHLRLGALSTPYGVALSAGCYETVRAALAPALAREAAAHLVGPGEGGRR